jgi:fatty-acyl-CoA synthase
MCHPAIRQAAAIGVHDPRWEERPLLICTLTAGAAVTADELKAHMAPRVAKWWLPEQILFVDELPLTATGKLNKVELRHLHNPQSAA